MSGLEKIMEDIRKESAGIVAKATQEAEERAEEIRKDAETRAQNACLAIRGDAEKEAASASARSASAAELRSRRLVLSAKQQMISDVLKEALSAAEDLPAEEYFAAVIRMAACSAHPGSGEIRFSRKDLERLPQGFAEKLNAALPQGSGLTVSPEAADVDGGFLLVYGGVEENCSFAAVLAAREDKLRDRVREILFP